MPFIKPPPYQVSSNFTDIPSYALLGLMYIQWSDTPDQPSLYLIKNDGRFACEDMGWEDIWCKPIHQGLDNSTTSYQWVADPVALGYNYTVSSPGFFLLLKGSDSSSGAFASSQFYLYDKSLLPSNASAPTTSTAVTSSTSSPSAPSVPATSAPASTVTSSSLPTPLPQSSAMGTSTQTTIGVAVGLGIPLFVILGLITWFLLRKNRSKIASLMNDISGRIGPSYSNGPSSMNDYNDERQREQKGIPVTSQVLSAEAPVQRSSWQTPAELPGDSCRP